MDVGKIVPAINSNGGTMERRGVPQNSGFAAKLAAACTGEGVNLDRVFQTAGEAFQVSPALLKAVARAESGLNPRAVSPAGAQGIMQLMPGTAASLGVSNPFDPVQSILGAARYLRSLLNQFHGDTRLALAAYNAGPGAVQRFGGIPPYRETRAYVERVLALVDSADVQPATAPAVPLPTQSGGVNQVPSPQSELPPWLALWVEAFLAEATLKLE